MPVGFITCPVTRISYLPMVFPISIPPAGKIFANLVLLPPLHGVTCMDGGMGGGWFGFVHPLIPSVKGWVTPPCGYCLKASMTGRVVLSCLPTHTPPLWIDESLITLCQRVRLQRRRTLFFIILVPVNGRSSPQ